MRVVLFALVTGLVAASGMAFVACGGQNTMPPPSHDAGKDTAQFDVPLGDIPFDRGIPDGGVYCQIPGSGGMGPPADPVAFCIERSILLIQHAQSFNAKKGASASWSSSTGNPDPRPHSVADDASYASSLADYHQWALLYGNTSELDGDLLALGPLLVSELAHLPDDYDGELYFNLRNAAAGLIVAGDMTNGVKLSQLAFAYARQIYSKFYTALPLPGFDGGLDAAGAEAGGGEGGASEGGLDGSGGDASKPLPPGRDPGASGDGILGVDQEPVTGKPGFLYQPDKVAAAAYALMDLANSNLADPLVPKWLLAARQALDHVWAHGRDSATGLYYASLVTTGSGADSLGTVTTPSDLLATEVQAKMALYLLREANLVQTATMPMIGVDAADAPAGILGPFLEFPFKGRLDPIIAGLDLLWDGARSCPGQPPDDGGSEFAPDGGKDLGGYMDGLIPTTGEYVQSKSTRPNATMFAALRLQVAYEGGGGPMMTPRRECKFAALRTLLANENLTTLLPNLGPLNTTFINVINFQQGYFDTVTQSFRFPSEGSFTKSYTASANASVIAGFNEQLIGFTK